MVLSGSWGCNGPPSLRRVGAVRAGAPRWALRHEPRAYGPQQARNLPNALTREEVTRSALALPGLLPSVRRLGE